MAGKSKSRKIDAPFAACKITDKPYVFISYAHDDAELVFPIIKDIYESGINVWYDQGIEVNTSYDNVIADHLSECDSFVIFLSNKAVTRDYVIDYEFKFAAKKGKKIIPFELEKVKKLPEYAEMMLKTTPLTNTEDLLHSLSKYRSSGSRKAEPIAIDCSIDAPSLLENYVCRIAPQKGSIITKYTGRETDVVIPDEYDSVPIVELKGTFDNCKSLVSVTIPHSVETIGYATFRNCRSLTCVDLPNNISSIGRYAFSNCRSLKSLTIPNSVTKINKQAFSHCERLVIECEKGSYAHSFAKANQLKHSLTERTTDEDNTDSRFFKSTTEGNFAYAGYCHEDSDDVISILSSLNKEGYNIRYDEGQSDNDDIFSYMCDCRTFIIFLSKNAIAEGSLLKRELALAKKLGKNMLIVYLDQYELPSNIDLTLGCTQALVRSDHSANDFKTILRNYLNDNDCARRTAMLAMPDYEYFINEDNNITLSKYVGKGDSVEIPREYFNPPKQITQIFRHTFDKCKNLVSVNIPETITSVCAGAFSHCIGLESIHVNKKNKHYCDIDGVLYDKSKKTIIAFPNKAGISYAIRKGTTRIEAEAFSSCTQLESVALPKSVTEIGSSAFSGCSALTGITIPSKKTTIGSNAFRYRKELTIYGKSGSPAEQYAIKNNIPFVKIKKGSKWWLWVIIILALLVGCGFALNYFNIIDFQAIVEQLLNK